MGDLKTPVSLAQMQAKLKGYFATIEYDRFTQSYKSRGVEKLNLVSWNNEALIKEGIRKEEDDGTSSLGLNVNFSQDGETKSMAFLLSSDTSGRFYLSDDSEINLLLDDNIKISQYATSHEEETHGVNSTFCEVSFSFLEKDWGLILKSKKIKFIIRSDYRMIEGVFSNDVMFILKGLYNNIFDENFGIEEIYNQIKPYELAKNIELEKSMLDYEKRIKELKLEVKTRERNQFIASLLFSKYFWWGVVILIFFIWYNNQ